MSSFKDLRKKLSLKRFHQKVDAFEERIEEKIKKCWTSMIKSISNKKKTKDAPEMEEKGDKSVKVVQVENLEKIKEKKKTKPPIKTKKPSPSRLNKTPPKSTSSEKKNSTKVIEKSAFKSVDTIPVEPIEMEVQENNEVVNVKSPSPANSISVSSKKRGRPKKNEGFAISKTNRAAPPKFSKKSKNIKKSKSK